MKIPLKEKVHTRRGSLLMDIKQETLTPTKDMFKEQLDYHISKADEQALIFQSATNNEILVGYQIELFSRSTRASKGIWVIAGVRKMKLFNPEYLLKNIEDSKRYHCLPF